LKRQAKALPDGLVVGWGKTPERNQLNVKVWQLYVAGQKPTKLEGSQEDKIVVEEPMEEKSQRGERLKKTLTSGDTLWTRIGHGNAEP
jgi:hypothetical protein